jgi:hypothetical protein
VELWRCTGTSCCSNSHMPGCFRHIIKSGSAHVTRCGGDRGVEAGFDVECRSRRSNPKRYQLTMSRHDAIQCNGTDLPDVRGAARSTVSCKKIVSPKSFIESVCSSARFFLVASWLPHNSFGFRSVHRADATQLLGWLQLRQRYGAECLEARAG